MELPDRVTVVEVGPHDGLRTAARPPATALVVGFLDRLSRTGLPVVDVAGFDRRTATGTQPDPAAVLTGCAAVPGVRYPVEVGDDQDLERALAAGAREVTVVVSASESHSERALGVPVEDALARARTVVHRARRAGCRVQGSVAMVAGCPVQGEVPPEEVVRVTTALFELGCDEVRLQDSIGVGTPLQVQELLVRLARTVLLDRVAVHLRDSYGQGLANSLAALEAGARTVVTSAGGLGGNLPGPGAAGNLATEDLLYALEGSGVRTGVELEEVLAATAWVAEQLGQPPESRVARAVLARRA